MNWTAEQSEQIQEFGRTQFKVSDVAIVLQISEMEFLQEMENEQSEAYKAYWKGRLLGEYEIRKSVMELANGGSSAAQTLAKQFIDEAKVAD